MRNDAAVAATAHANPCARFAITKEITAHPHLIAEHGRSHVPALALSLPEALPHHDLIIVITFAVVAFSVFAHGLTITPLLHRLGLISTAGG